VESAVHASHGTQENRGVASKRIHINGDCELTRVSQTDKSISHAMQNLSEDVTDNREVANEHSTKRLSRNRLFLGA